MTLRTIFYFLHFYFSSKINFYWPLCNPKQLRVQVGHRAHIPQWLECDKEPALLEPEHMTVVARLGSNFRHSRRHGTWIASLCSEKINWFLRYAKYFKHQKCLQFQKFRRTQNPDDSRAHRLFHQLVNAWSTSSQCYARRQRASVRCIVQLKF